MLYSLRITLLLALYQVFLPLAETSNIFIKTTTVDDDDGDNRHGVEKPPNDVVNPPIFKSSEIPSDEPSKVPSVMNINFPSNNPTKLPSKVPSIMHSNFPSKNPTKLPSSVPSKTSSPSERPSNIPSSVPSKTHSPSQKPSNIPSRTFSGIPSKNPSNSYSPSTSQAPSKYVCKISGDGSFGETGIKMTEEKIVYRYEVDVNMTLVKSTTTNSSASVNMEELVSTRIAPNIKTKLSDSLFPNMFDECQDNSSNSTNSSIIFQNLQGMSSKPDDALNSNGCITGNTTDIPCALVDGGYTLYFSDPLRRRRLNRKEEMERFELLIKNTLESIQMLSADPAIIRISFIEPTTKSPVIIPNQQKPKGISESTSSTSSWLIYVIAGGGGGLLIAGAIIAYRKAKSNEEDDSISGESDLESESDDEVTWNHAIQTEMKRSTSAAENRIV